MRSAPPLDAFEPPDAPPIDAAPIDAMPLACSTAGLSCAGGQTTFFMCGGNCWVRCTLNVPYATAKAACTGWMGTLGEVDDGTENNCVLGRINNAPAWLGLIQSDTATTPTTGWTWNGTTAPMIYTHWAQGEPEDGGGGENGTEQCGYMRTDGTWDDDSCGTALDFLCERP